MSENKQSRWIEKEIKQLREKLELIEEAYMKEDYLKAVLLEVLTALAIMQLAEKTRGLIYPKEHEKI